MLIDFYLAAIVEYYVFIVPEDMKNTVRLLLLWQFIKVQMVLAKEL